jgi:hypothetical protein
VQRADVHLSAYEQGVSLWVRFANPGAGIPTFAGIATDGAGDLNAAVVTVTDSVATLEMGLLGVSAFLPQKTMAIGGVQYGVWYRLDLVILPVSGRYIMVGTLWDLAFNRLAAVQTNAISGTPGTKGLLVGVAGGATIDTVELFDHVQGAALAGGLSGTTEAPVGCPDGQVVTGVAGVGVDVRTVHCATIVAGAAGLTLAPAPDVTAAGGGPGGAPFDVSCAQGSWVTGVTAYVPYDLQGLQLACTAFTLAGTPGTYALVPGATTPAPTIGVTGTTVRTFLATPGHAVVGFEYLSATGWEAGVTVQADAPWVAY